MTVVNATEARRDLFNIINLALGSEKVTITSKNGNTVLVSEEYLDEILETLYLLSDPDTLPAMREALAVPQSEREVWHCPKDIS